MGQDFLGTGWAFPVLPDSSGRLRYVADAASIQDCLLVLLQTAAGERLMRPDFGTTAPTVVFAPGSPANLRALEASITSAIQVYEPRVDLDSVAGRAGPRPGKQGRRVGLLPDQADEHKGQPGVPLLPRHPGRVTGMTLAPVRLDDLTWDQMVEAIRRRIPAESSGNWTLHAPADPGITFLDVFAFLAEQRLYWLDQVPDAFVVAVLRLLGQDDPRPARPATTVLQITSASQESPVPAGAMFTRDPSGEVVFTLDDPVTVLPVGKPSLILTTDGQDRTADLRAGRDVDLLPADGGSGEACITFNLSAPAPDGYVSLLIELADPVTPAGVAQAAVPPAWSPEAVDEVPPPAVISWAYDDPAGVPVPFGPGDVTDGTQGLRRSGIVTLAVPQSWTAGSSPGSCG